MATKIQVRRDTSSNWTSSNTVLSAGEIGFETNTGKFKIGNGSSNWTSLSYASILPSDLDELSQDAVNNALVAGTGLDKTYDDASNTITLDIDSTVTTNSGTQTLTNKTLTSPVISDNIIFEGLTANEFETILTLIDPTADRTITLPDNTGTVALTSDVTNTISNIGIKTNNLEAIVSGIENQTTVDTTLDTDWRTLKYLLQFVYSNEVHVTEVILANDGSNLLISQYGDVYSNTELATVSAEKTSGIISLKITPVSGKSPITVRFFRTGIKF